MNVSACENYVIYGKQEGGGLRAELSLPKFHMLKS